MGKSGKKALLKAKSTNGVHAVVSKTDKNGLPTRYNLFMSK